MVEGPQKVITWDISPALEAFTGAWRVGGAWHAIKHIAPPTYVF